MTPTSNPSQTPAQLVNRDLSVPKLNNDEFETLIKDYGYDVEVSKAVKCPCTTVGHGYSAHPSCMNCGGSGWYFLTPVKTILVLQSMGSNRKYENWTEENMGTVNITARYGDKLSYMDKITLIDGVTEYTQQLIPFINNKQKQVAFTIYEPTAISSLLLFTDASKPLKELKLGVDYTFSKNLITFLKKPINDQLYHVSIRYEHKPQYHVIDIQRDIMVQSRMKQCTNDQIKQNFPVRCVGKIAHNILSPENRL